MSNDKGLDYFFRNHWLSSIQERVSFRARKKMYELWVLRGRPDPGVSVLDVGATPDCERMDSNCMLDWILESKMKLSVVSPEDLSPLKSKYPLATMLKPLPFNSHQDRPVDWDIPVRSFNWVISSAVLEHAGKREAQIHFLRECGRVADGIFLTTPNRHHWLEFHTKLPLIHWLPKAIHRKILRLLNLHFWSMEENLNLLTRQELNQLAAISLGKDFEYDVFTIWTLGMPSNLILIAKRKISATTGLQA
jgi:hypothetical protein